MPLTPAQKTLLSQIIDKAGDRREFLILPPGLGQMSPKAFFPNLEEAREFELRDSDFYELKSQGYIASVVRGGSKKYMVTNQALRMFRKEED